MGINQELLNQELRDSIQEEIKFWDNAINGYIAYKNGLKGLVKNITNRIKKITKEDI